VRRFVLAAYLLLLAKVPGLSAFIRDMVHGILGPMMYEPNVFTLNLEQMLSGAPLDAAIGVVQVTLQTARAIKGGKLGGGTPDPYVKLSINNRKTLGKTHYKKSTYVLNLLYRDPIVADMRYVQIQPVLERDHTHLGQCTSP
jgi:Ca2+-dependent lipid-binding protein